MPHDPLTTGAPLIQQTCSSHNDDLAVIIMRRMITTMTVMMVVTNATSRLVNGWLLTKVFHTRVCAFKAYAHMCFSLSIASTWGPVMTAHGDYAAARPS